jgi:hypothetical protein
LDGDIEHQPSLSLAGLLLLVSIACKVSTMFGSKDPVQQLEKQLSHASKASEKALHQAHNESVSPRSSLIGM